MTMTLMMMMMMMMPSMYFNFHCVFLLTNQTSKFVFVNVFLCWPESDFSQGAKKDPRDIQGRTPIYLAASVGGTETVQLLMDRGADITLKDVEMRSPLHVAIGNSATMEALIKVHDYSSDTCCGFQGSGILWKKKSIYFGLQVFKGRKTGLLWYNREFSLVSRPLWIPAVKVNGSPWIIMKCFHST